MTRAPIVFSCALALACRGATQPVTGDAIVDEKGVHLVAARGEVVTLLLTKPGTLAISGATVRGYAVETFRVIRPSSALYGKGKGTGAYADGLQGTDGPASAFEISAESAGTYAGQLTLDGRSLPVELVVATTPLPRLPLSIWAYEDPRELGGRGDAPSAAERSCIALFARHGVLLSPDIPFSEWPARRDLVAGSGFPFIPAVLPDDPAAALPVARDYVAAARASGQVPFAIPIDEPRTPAARARVRALADALHGSGFLVAVTDFPRAEYGDADLLYISPRAAHLAGDRAPRWTYNGRPPEAGAMVLDAEAPGPRTWGWIAWRWRIPVWYVWDALYWHDRHNRGAALDPARDPVSFDEGDDQGNLDGVLALPPDCRPTLRLWALRRGLFDRQLLELAASCDAGRAAAVAARMVPRALGDADDRTAWPTGEADWETARRELLAISAGCAH